MMKIKLILLISFITFYCKSQEYKLYEFDPTALTKNKITLANIADDIYYIPLDNKFPISDIFTPKITTNSIFLYTPNGLIAFNRDGKMPKKIGNIGRGPEEYLSGINFAIDVKHETVYILNRDNLIKVYSRKGDYIRSISLHENLGVPDLINLFNSKIFMSYLLQINDAKYNWIILDSIGNIVNKKERSIPHFTSNFGTNAGTYFFNNNLHYWNPWVDTVFSILPDLSYKASFILMPGEHRLPKSNFNPSRPPNMIMHIRMIFETSNFLIVRYDYVRPIISLIDKKSRKSFLAYADQDGDKLKGDDFGGILNDIDGGINFIPSGYFVENGREFMFALINSYQIKNLVVKSEFKNFIPKNIDKKKEFENLADLLKETDNPVLVLVRLKK